MRHQARASWQRAPKVIDGGAPLLARLTTLFRRPQNRVIRC
jgi:hypothetical protein